MKRKKRPTWIPVVTGLIVRDGKILIGRRPDGAYLSGVWEFPGGKIELEELPQQALARELDEELGIQAEIGELALATSHTYGDTGIVILFFHVQFWKGEVKSVQHDELRWIEPHELKNFKLPDANVLILPQILEQLSSKDR